MCHSVEPVVGLRMTCCITTVGRVLRLDPERAIVRLNVERVEASRVGERGLTPSRYTLALWFGDLLGYKASDLVG